ncbi:MAG: phosphoglycolate phosphatase [Bryobacteraceae bacterium]|nr:MAG: phosphoglycolate phosphatase [Bryobacteraceae bacterium]
MIPRFQLYLFDVDGTLVDSADDICGAVREALAEAGVDQLSDAYLRSFIGHHLFDLFREVLPDSTQEDRERLLARYRSIYLARRHAATRVYPGVEEMLAGLGGLKSTATTKSSETARQVLELFGLARHFDHIQGTDGFPSKPAPDVVLKSLERLGVRPEDCLLVGDAAPDMEAGRRAGVRTCAVTWGYGDLEAMRSHQPDFWIDSPAELLS